MASATAPPPKPSARPTPSSPSLWSIPAPLQKLFNQFPLVTLESNPLPARSQILTSASDTLPTLYVFSSDDDALQGKPSINPTCLKWQTLLRLSHIPFQTLPSTNHASPTGSLPFLLPPRTPSPSPPPLPIPSHSIPLYISRFTPSPSPSPSPSSPGPTPLRKEAYLSLLTPLRLAYLTTLYLTPPLSPLLRKFYLNPSTTRSPYLATLLQSHLSSAAATAVLQALGFHPQSGAEAIDRANLEAEAAEALDCLAVLLRESHTGWFFGLERPGEFDAALYGYVGLIMEHMDTPEGKLGGLVRRAGEGELVGWWERIRREAWGDLEGLEGEK
ncbi:hypothetical protein QBC41DRAFT_281188 [Cercophora samala]|uniref:Uncharacterized protein n=1 Tax=Cercophora samala TaxID=330535 RepID=A0AA39Z8N2_9PEZI|nr:hypothetical protein QBC41DRAFT_281188 [Cercophora samala]